MGSQNRVGCSVHDNLHSFFWGYKRYISEVGGLGQILSVISGRWLFIAFVFKAAQAWAKQICMPVAPADLFMQAKFDAIILWLGLPPGWELDGSRRIKALAAGAAREVGFLFY